MSFTATEVADMTRQQRLVQNLAAIATSAAAVAADLAAHVADPTDAHDASAISNVPAGGIAATDVQAALNELDTEKATTGSVATAQAFAIQRANHTGTQLATTISDFSTAADARVAAAVGVTVQSYDATLASLAGNNWAANAMAIGSGADTVTQVSFPANTFAARASTGNLVAKTITDFGLSLVDDVDASAARTTLGLVIGTNVQAQDAELQALAGLTSAANKVPRFTGSGTADLLDFDTDTALSANSDTRLASQKAVKAYIDALLASQDALVFKGGIDCSASPNYPAADAGHFYKITVAGKIGGASGAVVQSGDSMYCTADGSAAGTQAAVGANWVIVQVNIDGAVVGPASAVDSRVAMFDGATGKLLKDSGVTLSGGNTGDETGARIATLLHAASAKTTLVDADEVNGTDSAAGFGLIRTTWANVWVYIKAKADLVYQPLLASLTSWGAVVRASGFDTFAATPSSANLRALLSDEAGTGAAYFVGGALGTPASGTLTSCTGLPVSTGVSGLGASVATFLATPSSANLAAALTDELGSGVVPFATTGTYTVNVTGLTTTPTTTMRYTLIGDIVQMGVDAGLSGTSNTTAMTLTGMPSGLWPTRAQKVLIRTQDNGGAFIVAVATVETTGVITLTKDASATAFTNVGTKSVAGFNGLVFSRA